MPTVDEVQYICEASKGMGCAKSSPNCSSRPANQSALATDASPFEQYKKEYVSVRQDDSGSQEPANTGFEPGIWR